MSIDTSSEADRLLSLDEVRTRLGGCSRQSLYNWADPKRPIEKRLVMTKLGSRTVVRESDLVAFISAAPVADIRPARQ